MEEYKLAKANVVTVLDNKENIKYNLLREVDFLLDCEDDELVDNYIEDNTHPDY